MTILLASGLLAATPAPGAPITDPNQVSPGLLGLAATVFLGVAVYLIWRGMNKQLKRISFEDDEPPRMTQLPLAPSDEPDPLIISTGADGANLPTDPGVPG